MQQPQITKNHPNATFALGTTPFAVLVVWGLGQEGLTFTQEVGTAIGGCATAAALFSAKAIKLAGYNLWEYGITGCCRRLWHGRSNA